MASIDLTFDTIKFIVQQFKTNLENINFTKIPVGGHCSFNDNFWNYWLFDSYQDMCNAYPDYVSTEFPSPPHTIPPEEYM